MSARSRSFDEEVWLAVADPSRRSLLELLINGGEATASGLASEVPFSRQAVAKHLAVLERANLVSSRRQGREVLFSVRAPEVDSAAQMLVNVGRAWDTRLQSIKRIAEELHQATIVTELRGDANETETTNSTP